MADPTKPRVPVEGTYHEYWDPVLQDWDQKGRVKDKKAGWGAQNNPGTIQPNSHVREDYVDKITTSTDNNRQVGSHNEWIKIGHDLTYPQTNSNFIP